MPLYILFNIKEQMNDDIISYQAELTMIAIVNRQVIAISKTIETQDTEEFYLEYYPILLDTMTLTLTAYQAKPIW